MTIATPSPAIDTIDFAPFINGTNKQVVADQLVKAFKETGFAYIINHDLPRETMDKMFHFSQRFFDLPMDDKMAIPHPVGGDVHRGYCRVGLETIVQEEEGTPDVQKYPPGVRDAKEHFDVGPENSERFPNIWPPESVIPGFRAASMEYFWAARTTELTLLSAIALGFGLPEDYFVPFVTEAVNQLRFLRYPSADLSDLEAGKINLSRAHSDFDMITLLAQDSIGGLEIENPKKLGEFLPIEPIPYSLVINAGDMLMRWSNGQIRSTVHRVCAPKSWKEDNGSKPARYSIPYFCTFDTNYMVEPIQGTFTQESEKHFGPTNALDYFLRRLAVCYLDPQT